MQVNAFSHLTSLRPYASPRSKFEQPTNNSPSKDTETSRSQDLENELYQQRQLQQLKAVDREVRAHELAHIAVGGRYVISGANFQYERGPDGRNYAVAGEVSIDTSEVPGDPQATLTKAQIILRAALAPANPSAQDRAVAARAAALIQQARMEVIQQASASSESRVGQQLDAFI